jgi:hypothetical protein
MLETQQEQLIKHLRKLHSQGLINSSDKKAHSLTIQEILDNFPQSLSDDHDDLPHKRPRNSAESSASPSSQLHVQLPQPIRLKSEFEDSSGLEEIARASTFPILSTSDMSILNSLDVGPNMGMNNMIIGDDLPELDPSVWDGLDLGIFNQWTAEQQQSSIPAEAQNFGQQQMWNNSNDQPNFGGAFCVPRNLDVQSWQGMGIDNSVDMESFLKPYVS